MELKKSETCPSCEFGLICTVDEQYIVRAVCRSCRVRGFFFMGVLGNGLRWMSPSSGFASHPVAERYSKTLPCGKHRGWGRTQKVVCPTCAARVRNSSL